MVRLDNSGRYRRYRKGAMHSVLNYGLFSIQGFDSQGGILLALICASMTESVVESCGLISPCPKAVLLKSPRTIQSRIAAVAKPVICTGTILFLVYRLKLSRVLQEILLISQNLSMAIPCGSASVLYWKYRNSCFSLLRYDIYR